VVGHGGDHLLQGGPHPLHRYGLSTAAGRPGQIGQVGPGGRVELEHPGQGVEDRFRGAGVPALFQPGVVVDAHPGELGHLLAAQTPYPSTGLTGMAGEARGLR
jgi:hypothetical protein